MIKIRIRDKHPGSATLLTSQDISGQPGPCVALGQYRTVYGRSGPALAIVTVCYLTYLTAVKIQNQKLIDLRKTANSSYF
jgi:hypothetical protein